MKGRIIYFFIAIVLLLGTPYTSSSNEGVGDSYNVENTILPESINYILGTPAGINMLNFIENKECTVDLEHGKTVTLPNADATLFKGAGNDGTQYGLLWITLDGKASFLLGVETSFNLSDLYNSYVKLHTVSGKIILIQNMEMNIVNTSNYSFQDNDDVTNSIQIEDYIHALLDTCTVLLILGLLSGGILLIAYILICLL